MITKKFFKWILFPFIKICEVVYLHQEGNLAYFDDMTKCHNRHFYNRVMKKKFLHKELYVYYIDIDGLKMTNDTFGHAAGSQRIKNTALELKEHKDLIEIARIGGDEFIAISAKKIELNLTEASWGCSHKEEFEDLSSCIHKADAEMYKKKEKKNDKN